MTAEDVAGRWLGRLQRDGRPIYLALANLGLETSVWKLFNEIPEIQIALKKAASAFP